MGSDPTHSQLAKDHDDHPLHELAALMAQEAVKDVGRELGKYWKGESNLSPVDVASSFFVHPDVKINARIELKMIQWANQHGDHLRQTTYLTVIEEKTRTHFDAFNQEIESIKGEIYPHFQKIKEYFTESSNAKTQGITNAE